MPSFSESIVKQATLEWFEALRYSILNAAEIAPEEPNSERETYAEVVLRDRLQNALVKDAIPNLVLVAENLTASVRDEDLIWVFVGLDRFYSGQGLYTEVEPWCEQCVSVTRTRLGPEHPDVATSLNNLAGLYKYQGRYTEAEPLYQQALELAEQSLGVNHPHTATIRGNLASLRDNQT